MKKDDGKEPEPKPIEYISGYIIILVVIVLIISFIIKSDPIDKAKGFLDDRGAKKERCAERAEDASTSYAAKKIYKACMSN